MALGNGFPAEQLPLNSPKFLKTPCIFPCYREFGREQFARDWILRQVYFIESRNRADSSIRVLLNGSCMQCYRVRRPHWVHPMLGRAGGEEGIRITRHKLSEFMTGDRRL